MIVFRVSFPFAHIGIPLWFIPYLIATVNGLFSEYDNTQMTDE